MQIRIGSKIPYFPYSKLSEKIRRDFTRLEKGTKSKAQTLHKNPVECQDNFLGISSNYKEKLVNFVFSGELFVKCPFFLPHST